MKKIIFGLLCLLMIVTAGLYSPVAADNGVYIKIGVYENEPKIFTDENGKVSGFWPVIMEYIASQEGWTIQWVHGTWQECLEKLQNNEIDIMPDVAYSEDRAKIYDFSQETVYVSWSRVYAWQGSAIHTITDLKNKSVAILKGSVNAEGPEGIKLLSASFDLNCTFIEANSYLEVFQLLDSKQADAGVVSKDFANTHAQDFNLIQTDIIFQPAKLHFAFPKGSSIGPYLKVRIDNQVKQLKADGGSLYYQSLDKWLGTRPLEKTMFADWAMWLLVSITSLALVLGVGYVTVRYQVKRKTKELAREIAEHKAAKDENRNLDSRQEAILSAVPDIIAEVDNNKIYTWVNTAGYQFFGEDVIGKEAAFYFEGEQDVYSKVDPVFQGDDSIIYLESWQRRRDGEKRLLGWWCRTLKDGDGYVIGALSTARDITERQMAEQALKESEERYRLRLDSMLEGCQIIDFNWRCVYVNNTAVKHSRHTREELLGRTVMEIHPGMDNMAFYSYLQHCMENRVPHRMEHLFYYADGSQGWFEFSMEPVPEGVFILSMDISERKKMEQSLIESEKTLRNMFEAVPEGIIFADAQGIIQETNQTVVDMYGYLSKYDIIGKNINELMTEESHEELKRSNQHLIETGVDRNRKCTFIRKGGGTFPGEMSTAVVKDNSDRLFGFIILTSDTTVRNQAEEEHRKVAEYREMDRLKTNLISTISHELRTPLASIKGYASLLLAYEHKLDKTQKNESIAAIDRATDRLTELIDHLLDMSRLDAGLLRLTLQPVKPLDIIVTALDEVKMRSPEFRFINKIKGNLSEINADGRRLRQVIDNLLENAVKYSPEGTQIKLSAEVKGDDLLVSIADQGRGIDESEYSKIFERMYRIEQRLQKDPGGLGLGLSLCKALVEGHGGKIWVESTPGKGSTFYFTIPLKAVEKESKNDEREPTKTGTG